MIIALAGRQSTGKTTIANVLLNQGYQALSFADRLKELVGQLYNWTLEQLNDQLAKEEQLKVPVQWDADSAQRLAQLIGAQDLNAEPISFTSRRQALQYIGTEVLRNYDPHFHVKELKKRIQPNGNYVIQDVRFPDELEFLKSQPDCLPIYLLRPYWTVYSNHSSETSLSRHDFQFVLLNRLQVPHLITRATEIIKAYYHRQTNFYAIQQILLDEVPDQNKLQVILRETFSLDVDIEPCQHHYFRDVDEKTCYWAGVLAGSWRRRWVTSDRFVLEPYLESKKLAKQLRKTLNIQRPINEVTERKQTYYVVPIHSAYIIDDLKKFDVYNETCYDHRTCNMAKSISNDPRFLENWTCGFVDGFSRDAIKI